MRTLIIFSVLLLGTLAAELVEAQSKQLNRAGKADSRLVKPVLPTPDCSIAIDLLLGIEIPTDQQEADLELLQECEDLEELSGSGSTAALQAPEEESLEVSREESRTALLQQYAAPKKAETEGSREGTKLAKGGTVEFGDGAVIDVDSEDETSLSRLSRESYTTYKGAIEAVLELKRPFLELRLDVSPDDDDAPGGGDGRVITKVEGAEVYGSETQMFH